MSLYASINDDAVEIETFMANGISFLEAQSENMHKLPLTDGNELIQNVTEVSLMHLVMNTERLANKFLSM